MTDEDLPEDYPYASPDAEARIKRVTGLISIVTVAMLVGGLYLALQTPDFATGSLITMVGFVGLILVPFVGKRMRRAALEREGRA